MTVELQRDRGVTVSSPKIVSDNMPTPADRMVMAALEASAEDAGARSRRMASGAGHDTAWMARISRSAMIFVPCREGRSHTTDEWAENDDITLGAAVLFGAVRRLDAELQEQT